jgi:hypothetical protein
MLYPIRATDPPERLAKVAAVDLCSTSNSTSFLAAKLYPRAAAFISDFRFLMERMAPAARTKLFYGEFFRLTLLIFRCGVITPLAAITLKPD